MGERAAVRTNKMLNRIGGMYVGKNVGYSKKFSDNYERIFGGRQQPGAAGSYGEWDEVTFPEGPLGMEIEWSTPPLVSNVLAGGAAEAAGVRTGQAILAVGGRDACAGPLPEEEIEGLMLRRPLALRLSRELARAAAPPEAAAADAVRRRGVAKVRGALGKSSAAKLREFALEERLRSLEAARRDPSALMDRFSDVQMPRAEGGEGVTRWDLRLPLDPPVLEALRELLSGGEASLGAAFAALAGGRKAELWELGAVVSEPGAAAQGVHFDAPARCLFTAFVALQDITADMGPTGFLPGTHDEAAHRRFERDPAPFLEGEGASAAASALLDCGDAAVYDSRVLHWGGANRSDRTRALLYVTFRDPSADVAALGVDQHSIRGELAGRFRLGDFRT